MTLTLASSLKLDRLAVGYVESVSHPGATSLSEPIVDKIPEVPPEPLSFFIDLAEVYDGLAVRSIPEVAPQPLSFAVDLTEPHDTTELIPEQLEVLLSGRDDNEAAPHASSDPASYHIDLFEEARAGPFDTQH